MKFILKSLSFLIFINTIFIEILTAKNISTLDKTKDFYSFDPSSSKWLKIKNFKNVTLLDNLKNKKNEILYKNLWAYDFNSNKWHLLNIMNYYILERKKDLIISKDSSNFFSIDFALGLGYGIQKLFTTGKNINLKKDGNLYFITNKNGIPLIDEQRNRKISYLLKYFQIKKGVYTNRNFNLKNISRISGKTITIPFLFSLNYNFAKKYRIGTTLDLTLQFIEKFNVYGKKNKNLDSLERKRGEKDYIKSPNILFKPSLNLGYKIYEINNENSIYVNLNFAPSLYFFRDKKSIFLNFFTYTVQPSLRYEKLIDKIKIFSSLGLELEYGFIKVFNTRKVKGNITTSSIKPIINLGIGYNFI